MVGILFPPRTRLDDRSFDPPGRSVRGVLAHACVLLRASTAIPRSGDYLHVRAGGLHVRLACATPASQLENDAGVLLGVADRDSGSRGLRLWHRYDDHASPVLNGWPVYDSDRNLYFDAAFIPSLWLPFSAIAFALAALFPVVRRRIQGHPIVVSWIAVARAIGCFSGLWAGGFAIYLFIDGEQLYAVWLFGLLGVLLAFPWRLIKRSWAWWLLFTPLLAFTAIALFAFGWLFFAFIFSPSQPGIVFPWLAGPLLPLALLALQVFALWQLRRRLCPIKQGKM